MDFQSIVVEYHQNVFLFVRSWQRQVFVKAEIEQDKGNINILNAEGIFMQEGEDESYTQACIDFLIRTHVLNIPSPAPVKNGELDDERGAAMLCFSRFGKMASYAAELPFLLEAPDRPLRSHSLLHISIAMSDLAKAQAQLDLGVPISTLAQDGLAPLHWALAQDDVSVMKFLLKNGANIDVRSDEGATPLMNACQKDNLEMVKFLLDGGATVDACDERGFTALHRAAEMGKISIVELLIGFGASPTLEAGGYSPLSLAKKMNNMKIVKLMER